MVIEKVDLVFPIISIFVVQKLLIEKFHVSVKLSSISSNLFARACLMAFAIFTTWPCATETQFFENVNQSTVTIDLYNKPEGSYIRHV